MTLAPAPKGRNEKGRNAVRWIWTALAMVVATPASADWPAERTKLIAAAEQEGSLVVFALPNTVMREFVVRQWNAAFPKIALQANVIGQPQFIARIRTERSAGKYLWDVAFSGHPAGYVLAKQGALDPILPELIDPEVNDPKVWGGWDQALVDEAEKYVFSMSAYLSSGSYDALHVPPEEAERIGPKIMLRPEYKGKIAWENPLVPGAGKTQGFFIHRALGDEGLRKLILNQKVVITSQQHDVVEAMAHGTAWFGIGPPVKMLAEPYVKAGVKLDIRSFGRDPDQAVLTHGGQTLYLFNKRPHPNATRLFVNWILTKDMQTRIAQATTQGSRRLDVPPVGDPDTTPIPGAKYDAPQREAFQKRVDATSEMVRELLKEVK